jgi:hypothetical protein
MTQFDSVEPCFVSDRFYTLCITTPINPQMGQE